MFSFWRIRCFSELIIISAKESRIERAKFFWEAEDSDGYHFRAQKGTHAPWKLRRESPANVKRTRDRTLSISFPIFQKWNFSEETRPSSFALVKVNGAWMIHPTATASTARVLADQFGCDNSWSEPILSGDNISFKKRAEFYSFCPRKLNCSYLQCVPSAVSTETLRPFEHEYNRWKTSNELSRRL